MANFINKYLNQSAYDADNTKQYPNTSLVGNDIVFAMAAPAFGGLTVKYNIVDPTAEVTLFKGGGGSSTSSSTSGSGSGSGGALPRRMIVDGVEEVVINTWRFETAGEHTVQYTFEDNTVPQGFLENYGDSIPYATDVIVGTDITGIGSKAFYNDNLTSATCLSTTPPAIGDSSSFRGDYPIYVPASAVATYKAATHWSNLSSRIFAIQ